MNWLTALWDHICYRAWVHSRKREIARRQRKDPQADISDLNPDQRRIQANEARQVLENRHFLGAVNAVRQSLADKALFTDPNQPTHCANLVISMQLLTAIVRELERKLDDGWMAEAELDEIQRKRRVVRFQR